MFRLSILSCGNSSYALPIKYYQIFKQIINHNHKPDIQLIRLFEGCEKSKLKYVVSVVVLLLLLLIVPRAWLKLLSLLTNFGSKPIIIECTIWLIGQRFTMPNLILFCLYFAQVLKVYFLEIVVIGQVDEVGKGSFEFGYCLITLLWPHQLNCLYPVGSKAEQMVRYMLFLYLLRGFLSFIDLYRMLLRTGKYLYLAILGTSMSLLSFPFSLLLVSFGWQCQSYHFFQMRLLVKLVWSCSVLFLCMISYILGRQQVLLVSLVVSQLLDNEEGSSYNWVLYLPSLDVCSIRRICY